MLNGKSVEAKKYEYEPGSVRVRVANFSSTGHHSNYDGMGAMSIEAQTPSRECMWMHVVSIPFYNKGNDTKKDDSLSFAANKLRCLSILQAEWLRYHLCEHMNRFIIHEGGIPSDEEIENNHKYIFGGR